MSTVHYHTEVDSHRRSEGDDHKLNTGGDSQDSTYDSVLVNVMCSYSIESLPLLETWHFNE